MNEGDFINAQALGNEIHQLILNKAPIQFASVFAAIGMALSQQMLWASNNEAGQYFKILEDFKTQLTNIFHTNINNNEEQNGSNSSTQH